MVVDKKLLAEAREATWPQDQKEKALKQLPRFWLKKEWRAVIIDLKKEEWNIFPLEHVTVTHTRSKECHSHRECFLLMQELQRKDIMENNLLDIKHNYYIGSNFEIYEGRGWLINSSRDPEFQHMDKKSCDIAYIGDFSEKRPPAGMEKAARNIMYYLVGHCLLKDEFLLTPFGQKEPIVGPDVCAHIRKEYHQFIEDVGLKGYKYY